MGWNKILFSASITVIITERKRSWNRPVAYLVSVCVSVCLSVHKVYCGKTADWIQMPFGVVSGVDRGMRVEIIEGEGHLWG